MSGINDANDFIRNLDAFAEGWSEDNLDRLIRSKTMDIFSRIVPRTPVKTSLARNGWKPTLSRLKGEVYNNVPYIEALENGHSRQAPSGMAMITINEVYAEILAELG